MTFASAKSYSCSKGELTLTSRSLSIDCENRWSKVLPISQFRFEVWGENLDVYDYYGKLRFRFAFDESEEWNKAFQTIQTEW